MMLGSDKGDVSVAGKLAKETGCDVWFSYYLLCTDYCITESYNMAFECYRQMIERYGAGTWSFFLTQTAAAMKCALPPAVSVP